MRPLLFFHNIANNPSEDRHAELLEDASVGSGSLFGVYDGHAGSAASEFVKNELFDFIKWEMQSLRRQQHQLIDYLITDEQARVNMKKRVLEHPFSTKVYQEMKNVVDEAIKKDSKLKPLVAPLESLFHPDKSIIECLQLAFLRADSNFLFESMVDPKKIGDAFAGACTIASLILDDKIYTANAGDCRAVLGKKTETQKWTAVDLSRDHGTDNPEERKRLINAHPTEPDVIMYERVKGMLQPTRGIGDGLYKDNSFNEILVTKMPNWHAPYTTALPDVSVHTIDPKEDKFIVLASDGLFDFFSSQEVNLFSLFLSLSSVILSPWHTFTKAFEKPVPLFISLRNSKAHD